MSKNQKIVTVSIVMPPEMARKARVCAAQQGKSRSEFVREAIVRALKKVSEGEA